MRLFSILTLLLLQTSLFAYAQRGASDPGGYKPPDAPKIPDDPIPPGDNVGSGGQGPGNANPAKANVPGALAFGKNPQPAAEQDNEADIEEIGEKLRELIEKLIDAIKDAVNDRGSSSSANATITSQTPLSIAAIPCSSASQAYSTCSLANANFSALPKTQQAGCLCNAYSAFDFNDNMESCYSFAQSRTQYKTYATAVASGTALCTGTSTCDSSTVLPAIFGYEDLCKTSSRAAATTTPPPSPTAAAATPPATGAASRIYGIRIAATLSGIMIFMALL